jgi:prevent-host-death family protein
MRPPLRRSAARALLRSRPAPCPPLALWLRVGYVRAMSTFSVADAKNSLSELIDRAVKGEGVVITRHGVPVVELRPVQQVAGPMMDVDLAWLDARRVTPVTQVSDDAGALVSKMRDEGAH